MTAPRKTTEAVSVRQFLLPKEGSDSLECEDAIGINESIYRFAVADGATEAFDAGNWARRLAHNWVQRSGLLSGSEFWQWLVEEGKRLSESWNGQQLSWYSEAKQRMGAFAAFVGVELNFNEANPTWTSIAIGDSCLVHVRGAELVDSFPISSSTRFGTAPILAPSAAAANPHALNEIAVTSGRLLEGDQLFLLSDAIASWYLMLSELGDEVTKSHFVELVENEADDLLTGFLELQRSLGRLKNDDVAIVRLVF